MILAIFADSKRPGRCRSCGESLTWAELISGKQHPFNGAIVGAVPRPAMFAEARLVEDVDMRRNVSHFVTCPQSAAFRRRAR